VREGIPLKAPLAIALAAGLALAPAASLAQSSQKYVGVQPAGQFLATQFVGQPVTNAAGETVGNINDLLFDKSGRVANVVIGVGGFLGIGEKNVAVPYSSLSITADTNGKRVIRANLSKAGLEAAPAFKATEKTVYMRAKEQATDLGEKAYNKAGEISDQAAKKLQDIRGNGSSPNSR
jgi:sporulation protein YlmC with PRC-barrel domain